MIPDLSRTTEHQRNPDFLKVRQPPASSSQVATRASWPRCRSGPDAARRSAKPLDPTDTADRKEPNKNSTCKKPRTEEHHIRSTPRENCAFSGVIGLKRARAVVECSPKKFSPEDHDDVEVQDVWWKRGICR